MTIDWSTLTPREVWQALKTAPRVAGEWRRASSERDHWRRNGPCGECMAAVRGLGDGGWEWWILNSRRGVVVVPYPENGTNQARAACDAALRAEGWVLVEGEDGS